MRPEPLTSHSPGLLSHEAEMVESGYGRFFINNKEVKLDDDDASCYGGDNNATRYGSIIIARAGACR